MFLTLFKAGRGRDKFFTIHDLQKDLFYKYTLAVYSGNVGGSIREKQYAFDSEDEKKAVLQALFKQKIKEGYKVIYEYPKKLKGILTRDTA
ncbi:MAG: WGR domain-containing protein [Spirochaetales bacterium]|nr:WGR domain-containing protein [Spirochaetales bacterium]